MNFEIANGWTYCISIVMGLLVGSFLNVVVVRLPRQESVVKPRSRCRKCERPILWYENIPLLSYLALLGKCKGCRSTIEIRYPMIEFLTALLFLAVRMKFGWSVPLFIKHWPFVSILLAITFIDLEFRMIPDVLSLGGLALGLLTAWIGPYPGWLASLTGAALGFGIFYSLAWIYQKLNHRAGLGGGDIKLIAMLGAFLGPSGVFVTILISSVFGSLVGVLWAISSRQKDLMKFAIPFGPFLVLGALSYYLLGDLLWFQFMIPM